MKKPSVNALKKKAHAIMRDIVIARDGKCVCPPPERGHTSILQAGHIIPGTKGGTYFDLWNVHCQCSACNGRHVHFEHYYIGWLEDTFGADKYKRLRRDCENLGLKRYELEEIIVQLGEMREKIKQEPNWKPYFAQQEILNGSWKDKK